MIAMRILAGAALAALLVAGACADEAGGIDCDNAGTQRDLNICADRDYRAADDRLNQVYRTLMAELGDAAKSRLRDTQRSWIASRDSQCRAESAETEGGSLHPLELSGCMAEKTKARTRELQSFPH